MDYNIFKSPLRHFIKAKINGGAVLLFVAAAATIIANTPLRESYDAFFAKEVILQFGDINLFHVHGGNMTFMSLINDALPWLSSPSPSVWKSNGSSWSVDSLHPAKLYFRLSQLAGGNARPHPRPSPLICPEGPVSRGSRHPDGHGYRFLIGSIILTRETHPPEPERSS